MGLDATVCCNCFETGRIRTPPDPAWMIVTEPDGHVECSADDLQTQMAFDRWRMSEACEHEDCVLVHQYIGNITRVARLRASLEGLSENLPIILGKVIYNGTHCGDWLDIATVQALRDELDTLAETHCPDKHDEDRLRAFELQLRELVLAALEVGKPIAF